MFSEAGRSCTDSSSQQSLSTVVSDLWELWPFTDVFSNNPFIFEFYPDNTSARIARLNGSIVTVIDPKSGARRLVIDTGSQSQSQRQRHHGRGATGRPWPWTCPKKRAVC